MPPKREKTVRPHCDKPITLEEERLNLYRVVKRTTSLTDPAVLKASARLDELIAKVMASDKKPSDAPA